MKGFKPNLIPNNKKDGTFTIDIRNAVIEKRGGIRMYILTKKKDGVRMEAGAAPTVLGRSLKKPGSQLVIDRFQGLNDWCLANNVILEGEFYMHGEKLNVINSFFANTDVTSDKYRKKLEAKKRKDPELFETDYQGRDMEWLTTFHKELKMWLFDVVITDMPELTKLSDRMAELEKRFGTFNFFDICVGFESKRVNSIDEMEAMYKTALEDGWEGLVMTHQNHEYKFGRNSLNQGTFLKLKDDGNEWDGVILDVEESTIVKEGVESTRNELGRSVTSKKKEDRIPSGMAKGFVVQFEDKGTFTVGLRGFNHASRKELLDNKENYIGKHFQYTGMLPLKDFPRQAYFDQWRDEK